MLRTAQIGRGSSGEEARRSRDGRQDWLAAQPKGNKAALEGLTLHGEIDLNAVDAVRNKIWIMKPGTSGRSLPA
jgi:hypothetical protein